MSEHKNVAVDEKYLSRMVGAVVAYEDILVEMVRGAQRLRGLYGTLNTPTRPKEHGQPGYIDGAIASGDQLLFLFMVTGRDNEPRNTKPWTRQYRPISEIDLLPERRTRA